MLLYTEHQTCSNAPILQEKRVSRSPSTAYSLKGVLSHPEGVGALSGEKSEQPEVQQPERSRLPPLRPFQRLDERPQRGLDRGLIEASQRPTRAARDALRVVRSFSKVGFGFGALS